MSQVDFYFLEKQAPQQIYPFAAKLLEKAFAQNAKVFVLQNNLEECQTFDNYLWTYSDISFLPHCLSQTEIVNETPIVLGLLDNIQEQTIILNLSHHVVQPNASTERVIEIVPDEPNWRAAGRQKYAAYKPLFSKINTHKL